MVLAMKIIEYIKIKIQGSRSLVKINLFFVLVFLNIWDFLVSREVINGMVLGFLMFGPPALLWFIGNFRSIAALTLISILEVALLAVFVVESFQLRGIAGLSTFFWVPYFLMAGINSFWGLSIYSQYREKRTKQSVKVETK